MSKVSVIIPTFNRVEYVRRAVESVLAQTYTELEVLVVDDGSTDATQTAIQQMADPRIRYMYQENAGRSAARNWGIQCAQGDYICLLDDDDKFFPNKIQRQAACLEQNQDVGLVTSAIQYIDQHGNYYGIQRQWDHPQHLTLENVMLDIVLIPSPMMLRRRLLDQMDHWFDSKLDPFEDLDFGIRFSLLPTKLLWLPDALCMYRIHTNNTNAKGTEYAYYLRKILDKLFQIDNLPESLSQHKDHWYAMYDLIATMQSYRHKQIESAQRCLTRALERQPDLVKEFVHRVSKMAGNDPRVFIEYVFNHLPPHMTHLKNYRKLAYQHYLNRLAPNLLKSANMCESKEGSL